MEKIQVPEEEFNQELPSGEMEELEALPEREWLKATIAEVKYGISYYQGAPQVRTDKNDNPITDHNGDPVFRREFTIEFDLDGYSLSNGEPRKCWVQLGASFNEKAHLPAFLNNLKTPVVKTPNEIINALKGLHVKLQVKMRTNKTTGRSYPQTIWDSVVIDDSYVVPKEEIPEDLPF